MRRIKSKTLKRFALSFLGVFALPVIFFVYLFINDFKEIYRDKVFQNEDNCPKLELCVEEEVKREYKI